MAKEKVDVKEKEKYQGSQGSPGGKNSAPVPKKKRKIKPSDDYDNLSGYIFISPFIIGTLGLTLFPILYSLYLSFTDFSLLDTPTWTGLDNYQEMFTRDPQFWQSLEVTFLYAGTGVPIRLVFALLIALALNKVIEMAGFYRTMLYLPSIVGGSVGISIMWRQLFGNEGAINSLLASMGLPTHSWLGDPDTAIWTLVVLYGWQFGSSMLIFLAGLRNIPKTFYEASSVDGANRFQQFFKITLPMLTPVILFNTIMQTIQGFMAFTPSFIITQGGPMNSTMLYILYMYRNAFQFFNMGYASAIAWFMLLIIAVFTALIFKSSEYWVHYDDN